jgi:hypothetical protein
VKVFSAATLLHHQPTSIVIQMDRRKTGGGITKKPISPKKINFNNRITTKNNPHAHHQQLPREPPLFPAATGHIGSNFTALNPRDRNVVFKLSNRTTTTTKSVSTKVPSAPQTDVTNGGGSEKKRSFIEQLRTTTIVNTRSLNKTMRRDEIEDIEFTQMPVLQKQPQQQQQHHAPSNAIDSTVMMLERKNSATFTEQRTTTTATAANVSINSTQGITSSPFILVKRNDMSTFGINLILSDESSGSQESENELNGNINMKAQLPLPMSTIQCQQPLPPPPPQQQHGSRTELFHVRPTDSLILASSTLKKPKTHSNDVDQHR